MLDYISHHTLILKNQTKEEKSDSSQILDIFIYERNYEIYPTVQKIAHYFHNLCLRLI